MNANGKTLFRSYVASNRAMMLMTLKTGPGRPELARCSNYEDLLSHLATAKVPGATERDVAEAAAIFGQLTGRSLEVQKPVFNDAARKLAELDRDSSPVRADIAGVDTRLDIDQLKHQPPEAPIGTRAVGGGNRFVAACDENWHRANTLTHMANWANGLGAMPEGAKQYHGQATPAADGIHYEGFCLMAAGGKHVLFHCYPSDGSNLKRG